MAVPGVIATATTRDGMIYEGAFGQRMIGMNNTAFKITPDMRARLAKVHQRGADGALTQIEFELPQDPEFQPRFRPSPTMPSSSLACRRAGA